jgi:hypothetical protein
LQLFFSFQFNIEEETYRYTNKNFKGGEICKHVSLELMSPTFVGPTIPPMRTLSFLPISNPSSIQFLGPKPNPTNKKKQSYNKKPKFFITKKKKIVSSLTSISLLNHTNKSFLSCLFFSSFSSPSINFSFS